MHIDNPNVVVTACNALYWMTADHGRYEGAIHKNNSARGLVIELKLSIESVNKKTFAPPSF